MSEWQPIETAPNSEKVVIFSVPTREIPIMARGDDYWLNRVEGKGTAYWLDGATHWMPLPPPPGGT